MNDDSKLLHYGAPHEIAPAFIKDSLINKRVGSVQKHRHGNEKLSVINEMAITICLFLLTIGTFLGSVWANESWGRY